MVTPPKTGEKIIALCAELQIQARQQLVHVPSLNAELVAETFRRCKRRLFMLDYDVRAFKTEIL